jgi:hypothetical protein
MMHAFAPAFFAVHRRPRRKQWTSPLFSGRGKGGKGPVSGANPLYRDGGDRTRVYTLRAVFFVAIPADSGCFELQGLANPAIFPPLVFVF